jgi:chromosomal replication initiator protein
MHSGDAKVQAKVEATQRAVAGVFGISGEELMAKSRRNAITVPRQIGMYLSKWLTDCSLPEIGRYFGGMHPTAVMHSIAKMEECRRTDPAIESVITTLLITLRME